MNDIKPENIQPAEKMLLIKIQEKATQTSSGLILAGDEKNTAPTVGEVLQVGKNSIYEKGDIVIFRRYAVDEIRYQDKEEEKVVYFIADSDALGKVAIDELPKVERYNAIKDKKELKIAKEKNEKRN